MRCGFASTVLALASVFPAAESVIAHLRGSAVGAEFKNSSLAAVQRSKGCPAACACEAGDPSNGGIRIANGLCYDFCSAPFQNWDANTQVRYCGQGELYTHGDYIDCRSCVKPEYFDGSYRLHQPDGQATGSIILLGPWNASVGWGMKRIMNSSDEIDPSIMKKNRIVDVAPKPSTWEGYGKVTAWYGYAGTADWYKNVPVAREVDHSVAYVHHLIEQEYKIVGDYRRIILVGLHQGANIALESALRFPEPLGLVFSQRGIVIPSRAESTEKVSATPSVLTAGGKDDVYPESLIKENCNALRSLNVPAFMKTVPGYDHFQWSKEESALTVRSFLVAFSESRASKKTLAHLTDWTISS